MSIIKPSRAVEMTSPPPSAGCFVLIDMHSVFCECVCVCVCVCVSVCVCGRSIKALATSVVISSQPVPQLSGDGTLLPHCKHNKDDTFWVLFLTNLLKQDPACPGACAHRPRAKTVVVPGTLARGQFVGGETGWGITVFCLSS